MEDAGMRADRDKFIDSMNSLDNTELRSLCLRLYDELTEITLVGNANDRINTESTIAYLRMEKELAETRKNLEERDKMISSLSEQLSLKTRTVSVAVPRSSLPTLKKPAIILKNS
jgi:hypothetical protein